MIPPCSSGQRITGRSAFLSYIKNEEIVVTDSFHAVVFSILYHKKFVCVLPSGNRARLIDLLEKLSLTGRIWKEAFL